PSLAGGFLCTKSRVSRRRRGLMGEMNEVYCLRSPSLANHVLSCIPASPVQLTFSIADNPPEICSLVVFVSSPKIK
ncbi:hypothetical protein, partial [Escherichia coli]